MPLLRAWVFGTHASSVALWRLKGLADLQEIILCHALEVLSSDCEFLDPLALARASISMAHVCYFRPMAVASTRSSHSKHTVLHVAALQGDHQCVRVVLRVDVEVDATNLQHNPRPAPLHLAVEAWHLGVAKLLLEAGAHVDQHTPTKSHRYNSCTMIHELWCSPLEIAVERGLRAIAMWLIGAGANHGLGMRC